MGMLLHFNSIGNCSRQAQDTLGSNLRVDCLSTRWKTADVMFKYNLIISSNLLEVDWKSNITRIHWLDRRIVRKQLEIIPIYHYAQNQRKLMMQSRENGQNSQFGHFFDDFDVIYLQIANFSEK